MTEFSIEQMTHHYQSLDDKYSVYSVREHPERGKLGGWATTKFQDQGQKSLRNSYRVYGEFVHSSKYGQQLFITHYEPIQHEGPHITVTASVGDLKRSNDAGSWFSVFR